MWGRGWESLTVKGFNLLKSMQKQSEPSFFPHQHNSIAPGTIAWLYHSSIQHHLEVSMHLIELRRRDPAESLLERGSIWVFENNFMLSSLSVARVMFLNRLRAFSACSLGHASRPVRSSFSRSNSCLSSSMRVDCL